MSHDSPKERFRRLIQAHWIEPLRELGFEGRRNELVRRSADEDVFHVFELQWSRFDTDNHVRVRPFLGAGRLSSVGAQAALCAPLCKVHVDVALYYRKAISEPWYEFGDEVAARNILSRVGEARRMLETKSAQSISVMSVEFVEWWGLRYAFDSEDEARAILKSDFETVYRPFVEYSSTREGYARLRQSSDPSGELRMIVAES
jgi:hypothetical protein